MRNFTFLTKEQCAGDNQLDIFKKRGEEAEVTDFAVLLGCLCINKYDFEIGKGINKGAYWTKSECEDDKSRAYYNFGKSDSFYKNMVGARTCGGRPVLFFSSVSNIPTNGKPAKRADDGVLEVEYGYYPQNVTTNEMREKLEREYQSRNIKSLDDGGYTTDSLPIGEMTPFSPQRNKEYIYNGKRYVRIKANMNHLEKLHNGEECKDGDIAWVEVAPIKWLVDEKSHMMVSEQILYAGIQLDKNRVYHTADFNKTGMKKFLDEYFAQEIEQARIQTIPENGNEGVYRMPTRKSRLERMNPDMMQPEERTNMSDTEIIHNWIESGESVLLRGPSGIGKTERIKELYPDLIYLKLTNNMFPEKVVGSTNLQTGQSIPPDFAKTAIMQGATEDEKKLIEDNIQNIYGIANEIYERSKSSDKKIVILLDELLNVKPAIQGLVYTLVLNKVVEIGEGLKLPANVVVVATGNQKKYSNVAEDLAEPLQKRFDHVLDMEPKVGEWLAEYAMPKKLHPKVIEYILSKYISTGRSENIKDMGYFYEEPEVGEQHLDKNGCAGRTNDPRGWAAISKILYNFERNLEAGKYIGKNVENIFQRSISSKLREEWAADFYDFYNMPTLTPEEIVQGMGNAYTQADLPRDTNERFAYMIALLTADDKQVKACREFVREYCDAEYLKTYDINWAGNDERRMEIISELQAEELPQHSANEAKEYAGDGVNSYSEIGKWYKLYLEHDQNKTKQTAIER